MNHIRCFIALSVMLILCLGIGCGDDDDDSSNNAGQDDDAIADDDVSDDDTPAADDDDNIPDGYREPFDPTQPGPYQVGNRTYIFVDPSRSDMASNGHRILLTEVWYPASETAARMPRDNVRNFVQPWGDFIKTVLSILLPPEEVENLEADTGSARNAPVHPGGGPYPLVIFSHGNASIRFSNMSMAEYLASHGYIVVSPDHIGNAVFVTLPDRLVIYNPFMMASTAVHRVLDTWFLTDHFTELNQYDPDGMFEGMVDVEKVGVIGHSYGAVTGTEWGILDDRVVAMVEIAAFYIPIYFSGYDGAIMAMMGTEDRTMGDWNPFVKLFHNLFTPAPKYLIEVYRGGHYTFSDACDLIPTLMGDGDGCGIGHRRSDGSEFEYLDQETSFAIMNSYITAFFGLHLKGQDFMLPFLTQNRFPEEMYLHAVPK